MRLRVGTVFSGIGAIEHALDRMGIEHEIVFACDNGDVDVLSKPISQPLSSNDLCEMMLNAQDESYGDGLDQDYRHPYMWLCKSHYYSAGLNFYNWPYAFGLLYAKGLYKEYLKDKEQEKSQEEGE